MKYSFLLLAIVVSWNSYSAKPKGSLKGYSAKEIVAQTAKSLEARDENLYMSLLDYDSVVSILAKVLHDDKEMMVTYHSFIQKPESFPNMHKEAFHELTVKLTNEERNAGAFKYVDYEITDVSKQHGLDYYSICLLFKNNDQKRHVRIYIAKYQGYYFLLEPPETTFSSGECFGLSGQDKF